MKNVAVIFGGDSSEFVVSEQSAANVFGWVDTEKYKPYLVKMRHGDWRVLRDGKPDLPIDRNDFSVLIDGVRVKFDMALIVIHGAPGENGVLQSYFDLTGVPYSTCSAFASMLAFNKAACKAYLAGSGVAMAKAMLIRRGDAVSAGEVVEKLGLPIFVKPNNGGSSFGVTKVKSEAALHSALEEAFGEDDEALAEEFIDGVEVTCGMMALNGVETTLPVTEVVSKNEFFDFGAKYNGMSEEITPARLSPEATALIQRTTSQIYRRLGCSGIIRVDYILRGNTPYFLEVNTVPGMTATSFIPQQVRAAGLSMTSVLSEVVEDALARKKQPPHARTVGN
ncbi:MAG: D-alanine--D-alanine ligase [Prevotellaceae bacterium]|jgi:D-alanine-D-alanine ligase|nr:D-alanine--D-alanine ligase [Prevotellaceae bacterium]